MEKKKTRVKKQEDILFDIIRKANEEEGLIYTYWREFSNIYFQKLAAHYPEMRIWLYFSYHLFVCKKERYVIEPNTTASIARLLGLSPQRFHKLLTKLNKDGWLRIGKSEGKKSITIPRVFIHGEYSDKLNYLATMDWITDPLTREVINVSDGIPRQKPVVKRQKITIPVEKIEDKNPQITAQIRSWYVKAIRGKVSKEFTEKEANKFIEASNKMIEFYQKIKPRLSIPMTLREFTEECLNGLLKKKENDINFKVEVGTLKSDYLYNDVYPKYLYDQAMVEEV